MLTQQELTTEVLKARFTENVVYDASSCTLQQLMPWIMQCTQQPELLVLIHRAPHNDSYFLMAEQLQLENHRNLIRGETIVLNKDNYKMFDRHCPNVIPAIRKMVRNDKLECATCYDELSKDVPFYVCFSCCSDMCIKCIFRFEKRQCPVCKSNIPVIL